ncbi:acetoin dehydrogenase dihydrolipoyllysine-residue acetyltransferase subunit [Mesorhizobium sp. AR07]|uniref:acetoin dehydrogenase dihydrolipoyllysine-residue acetyltransferase subunit n=1 Tax=Mesorhizobium sp. AR07 TaxID=2865838 RepID=UPI0021601B1D|nr:acetoin dehydrogenase dihydrolipoyllysine-residue acetyltransferase subunit [Mesorhizobium sp. AR07]UVK41863.1 acetoin dehydrogenase dihydrolipoyllysine-residue acetyltransferase subunit [Mesorhizobium sp. AR07]
MQITPISMPTWGLTMEEGTLVEWLVPEGARVVPGMELAEIETAKVTNMLEAQEDGVLRRHVITAGETRACGALIGVLADETVLDAEVDAFIARFAESAAGKASAQAPEPRQLDLPDGRRLRYLRVGEGGTAALLIHGFGGDLDAWQMIQASLAIDRAVYAIDLPGHGESTKEIRTGDLAELAETVVQAMDALGLERVHLVGHSLGAGTALQLALTHPGRVASLALIAPLGLAEGIDPTFPTEFLAATKTRDLQRCLGRLFADPAMVGREFADRVARNKRLDGAEAALAKIVAACFPDGHQRTVLLSAFTAWSAENPTIPVTVVWGQEDAILSPDPLGQLPASVVAYLIPNVGHMPQLEAMKEVNAILCAHVGAAA